MNHSTYSALAARLTPNKVVSDTLMTGEGGCSFLEALRFLLSLEDLCRPSKDR